MAALSSAAQGDATAASSFETVLERCRKANNGLYAALAPSLSRSAADLNCTQDRWQELLRNLADEDAGNIEASSAIALLTAREGRPAAGLVAREEPEQFLARALLKRRDGEAAFRAGLAECQAKLKAIEAANVCDTLEDALRVVRAMILERECNRLAAPH
jgi:hypothetical protein